MTAQTDVDPASLRGSWNYPTQMLFGAGRIRSLAQACKGLGMSRPLLVTDPGLAGLPMVRDAIAANEAEGLPTGLFSEVKPNPVGRNVDQGVAAFKAGGHDGVIAFGGGSGLDAAKAVAFMSGQAASRRSSPCRPRRAPARRSAAPRSSSTRRATPRRSSSTR
jgi:alcohol dehydrogenase class IV